MSLGFLHTAGVHVPTFELLLRRAGDSPVAIHLVDQSLLDDARQSGDTASLRARVTTALHALAALGVERIVCTCSTIGGIAEEVGTSAGLDVIRVDRPMAKLAVSFDCPILVVAALGSTVAHTRALLADEARRAGRSPEISHLVVADAWKHFEAGDSDAYVGAIETAIRRSSEAANAGVIVLAQASMAGVADRLVDLGMPVLASPALAVEAARRGR